METAGRNASGWNPYGVGRSGEDFVERQGRCACCHAPFAYRSHRKMLTVERWCHSCQDHHPFDGEDLNRRLNRAETHEQILSAHRDAAVEAANKAEARVKQGRGAVASALRQRNEYSRIITAVMALHLPSGNSCASCGGRYPCESVTAVRRINPRIADVLDRQVDKVADLRDLEDEIEVAQSRDSW
jgi:excinuclease UvrABC ATPase subunit